MNRNGFKYMKKINLIRIFSDIFILIFIIWMYWWITWPIIIISLFIFPKYFEMLAWGIIYDALYGIHLPAFFNIDYIFTIVSIVLLLLSLIIRRRLIIYES